MSVHPAPVNGTIPIMIGGAGHRRILRAVARSADEWNAWGRPDLIAGHLEVLRGRCESEGRSFDDLHLTAVGLLIFVDNTETSATLCESLAYRSGLIGTVDELKAVIDEYRAIGVDELIVPDFAIAGPGKLDIFQRFQYEVLAWYHWRRRVSRGKGLGVEHLVAGLFGADHRRFGGPGEVDPLVGSLPDVLALHQRVRLLVEHGGTHLTDPFGAVVVDHL